MNVNGDLQKERGTCSFHVEELTNIIHHGAENAQRRRQLAELVSSDPVLSEKDFHRAFLGKADHYERALQKFLRFKELNEKYQWSEEDRGFVLGNIRYDIGLGVHFIMFIPAIEKLATEEQKRKWLPLARSYRIIGTYCQTELGHGTDLRHLETRADYDKDTKQFVLNTPHITSMKWWPGGLGLSVNHVLLLAQLYVDGMHHGMQPFIVQIRDVDTHQPLTGVKVGSIGPTMSATTTDNGYLALNNMRIPRENMLMKYNEVQPDGTFISHGTDRSTYGTMIFIRADICATAWQLLAISTTIATRYSAVRRQTELQPGAPEPQILDYQTQQMKLFPNMAASFAIYFTHRHIIDSYNEITQQMAEGDNSRLPELHAQAAGFKALTTDIAAEGVEIVRRSCGGHGYLLSSGLPFTLFDICGAVTYDGENTVLYLQVARYLLKQLSNAYQNDHVDGSLQFLKSVPGKGPISGQSSLCMADVSTMLQAFDRRTVHFLAQTNQTMQSDMVGGLQMHEAWNRSLVNLVKVAKMYLDQCMVKIFYKVLTETQCTQQLHTVLFRLFYLHMVHRIVQQSGEFLECGALTVEQMRAIKREEIRVLPLLRSDAVSIMDAFDYTDNVLVSTLGRYDGNVYEALFESAKQSPLNMHKVHPAIKKHILPMIEKAKL